MSDHITDPQEVPLRQCNKCRAYLPATADYFHRDKQDKDGLWRICKSCRSRKQPSRGIDSDGNLRCVKCGQSKPATSEYFEPFNSLEVGLRRKCRVCRAAQSSADSKRRASTREATEDPNELILCRQCNEWKPKTTANFYKDRYSTTGFTFLCIPCTKQYRDANKEHESEQSRKYYAANREKRLANSRDWQAKNKKHLFEYNKRHHEIHKERYAKRWKVWASLNKNRLRFLDSRRRALEKNAPGEYTPSDIDSIYRDQAGRCAYCQCEVGDDFHVDHILALSRGGSNWPDNLAIACPSCNSSKRDKLLYTEWTPPNPL